MTKYCPQSREKGPVVDHDHKVSVNLTPQLLIKRILPCSQIEVLITDYSNMKGYLIIAIFVIVLKFVVVGNRMDSIHHKDLIICLLPLE
jgi:hypothetical protein